MAGHLCVLAVIIKERYRQTFVLQEENNSTLLISGQVEQWRKMKFNLNRIILKQTFRILWNCLNIISPIYTDHKYFWENTL